MDTLAAGFAVFLQLVSGHYVPGTIVAGRVGNISVTFDNRVIDGKRAADFGLAVIARLQS